MSSKPESEKAEKRIPGVLADHQILAEGRRGRLIVDSFSESQVKQTCYELRAGSTYYDFSNGGERIDLAPETPEILIKPYQLVVVITMEELQIPADMVGHVLSKGSLFSLGIHPVNTFADAGFFGRMGIVLFNSTGNYIKLPAGTSIAKIQFNQLSSAVERPYAGQHGYQTQIWPVPTQFLMTTEEARTDPRVASPVEEIERAFGHDLGAVAVRIFKYERLLLFAIIAYTFLSLVIILLAEAQGERLSTLTAFILGLITNLVTSGLLYFATTLPSRRARRRSRST